nr:MAG TPA: hypothetical protein [Caudoviricetes sp.]
MDVDRVDLSSLICQFFHAIEISELPFFIRNRTKKNCFFRTN